MATYQDIKKGVEAFCDKTIRDANHMDKLELIVGLNEDSYYHYNSGQVHKWNMRPFQLRIEYIKEKLTEAYEYHNSMYFKTRARTMISSYIVDFFSCIRHYKTKDYYENKCCEPQHHESFVHDLACIIMRFNHDNGVEMPENQTIVEAF